MPTKYLAITIAGAVSLGSYEAGVTYEILDAIRQHNDDPETGKQGDFIRIDVLTGASAGGMTAAIVAQKLLYQKSSLVDGNGQSSPYDNPLYDCWVKAISLAGLLSTMDKPIEDGGDPATLSMLSSQLIEQIAQETLAQRDASGQIPSAGGAHNAIDAERGIRLGLALTNINGVNYGYPLFGAGRFQYTNFSDQMLRQCFSTDRAYSPWKEISEAAVACGAFPFAFRTKDLDRARSEYDSGKSADSTLEPWPNNEQSHCFTYTDGGVLQNQPLGMAKNLVDLNDQHLGNDNRFYLCVSPSPMKGIQNLSLTEANTNMIDIGKRLIDIYMGQAIFRDWIQAQSINDQIAVLDSRAKGLAQALERQLVDPNRLLAVTRSLLPLLFTGGDKEESAAAAQSRLELQYADEVRDLGGVGTAAADAFLQMLVTLEKAANLGERDLMQIYGIVTDADRLAGAGLAAFVGFFDQRFRDHDYDWGRTVAQQLLSNPQFSAPGQLGPIRYKPAQIREIDPTWNGPNLNAIPKPDVTVLSKGLKRRVNQIIDDVISNPIERMAAKGGADVALTLLIDWEFSRAVPGTSEAKASSADAPVKPPPKRVAKRAAKAPKGKGQKKVRGGGK
jgi:predicted acylesterase/phospholipase RssA